MNDNLLSSFSLEFKTIILYKKNRKQKIAIANIIDGIASTNLATEFI